MQKRSLCLALVILTASNVHASVWETVASLETSGRAGQVLTIVEDPEGQIFVGGRFRGVDIANQEGFIAKFNSGSEKLEVVNSFNENERGVVRKILVTPTGKIIAIGAVGAKIDSGPEVRWAIRSSADGGKTWVTNYSDSNSSSLSIGMNLVSYKDLILAIGRSGSTSNGKHTVLQSKDDGTTWEVADQPEIDSKYSVSPNGLSVSESGYAFAGSLLKPPGSACRWLVRMKNLNDESPWTTVGDFEINGSTDAFFDDLSTRGHYVYAIGSYLGAAHYATTIKRYDLRNKTWETLSDFVYASNGNTFGHKLLWVEDRLLMTVEATTLDQRKWIVAESQDFGKTWKVVDDYAGQYGTSAFAYSIFQASDRDILVGGSSFGKDKSGWPATLRRQSP